MTTEGPAAWEADLHIGLAYRRYVSLQIAHLLPVAREAGDLLVGYREVDSSLHRHAGLAPRLPLLVALLAVGGGGEGVGVWESE